jgi:hypothetical protein
MYFKSQISWLVLFFGVFVLTSFLLFFQCHRMLEKDKEWNWTLFLILSNFHFTYFGIKLLGEPIIETLYFYMWNPRKPILHPVCTFDYEFTMRFQKMIRNLILNLQTSVKVALNTHKICKMGKSFPIFLYPRNCNNKLLKYYEIFTSPITQKLKNIKKNN